MSLLNTITSQMDNEADWLPNLMKKLPDVVNQIDDTTAKASLLEVLLVLERRKEDIKRLSKGAFVLFITYIASHRTNDAVLEYIRTEASVDELITGMLTDAVKIVVAKENREQLALTALSLIGEIAFAGAKALLPLLLVLI